LIGARVAARSRRFSDLRDRLDGVSPSVLTARLARAQRLGLHGSDVAAAGRVDRLRADEHGSASGPRVRADPLGGPLLYRRAEGDASSRWMHLA